MIRGSRETFTVLADAIVWGLGLTHTEFADILENANHVAANGYFWDVFAKDLNDNAIVVQVRITGTAVTVLGTRKRR